jgi:hypothetical protein
MSLRPVILMLFRSVPTAEFNFLLGELEIGSEVSGRYDNGPYYRSEGTSVNWVMTEQKPLL